MTHLKLSAWRRVDRVLSGVGGRDRAITTRYRCAGKAVKAKILDELCATTGWHRDHARKALLSALTP